MLAYADCLACCTFLESGKIHIHSFTLSPNKDETQSFKNGYGSLSFK